MLLALDPGKTTGWASYSPEDAAYLRGEVQPDEIWKLLEDTHATINETITKLIVERFVHRSKFKVDLTPVEVIGVVKEWARQTETMIIWQQPSQAKHFFTNDRLKERGVYLAGKPHANDALRHLLYYQDFGKGR